MEPAGQYGAWRLTFAGQGVEVGGGDRRCNRDADRPAEPLEVLGSPGVSPASWLGTLARQAIEMGTKLKAVPALGDEERPDERALSASAVSGEPVAAYWR
jgi:hypothetical protein